MTATFPTPQTFGTQAELDAFVARLASGTEYVWFLTDGQGTLLDIVPGVA